MGKRIAYWRVVRDAFSLLRHRHARSRYKCARRLAADPNGLPVGECARYDAACRNPAGAIEPVPNARQLCPCNLPESFPNDGRAACAATTSREG